MNTGFHLSFPRLTQDTLLWVGGVTLTACLWLLMIRGEMNVVVTLIILSTLLLFSLANRVTGILLTLAFLNILGDVRRLVAASFGQPQFDSLLLVGPTIAFVLTLPHLLRVRLADGLSKAMFLLLVLMVLQVFNPMQGGISVGLSGAIFYIAPILWFWIGRQFASPFVVERMLYWVLLPLSVSAAILGLCQTFVGFLPYEQAWINIATRSYVALYVGHSVRAFGFSVSSAEYAALLAMGGAASAAAYFGARRYWAITSPLLAGALVLASSRGAVIKLVMSLAMVWVMRKGGRFRAREGLYAGLLLLAGLVSIGVFASEVASSDSTSSRNNSTAQNLIAHQTGGFAHPLDPRYSTAGIHSNMVLYGLIQGVANPVGHGLGSTTLAAARFGGDPSVSSSELDISDMFISLGLIGGLLYLYVVIATIGRALHYVQVVEIGVSLPVVAILVVTLTTWLIGGQYSTSAIVCFIIGALAYPSSEGRFHLL